MKNAIVLGIDIGGSHITTALVDIKVRTLIADSIQRNLVDSQASSEMILQAWCDVIMASFAGYPHIEKYVGIAMPGPFDYENGICLIKEQDKFKSLFGSNIKFELAKRLAIPITNIHFINDAAAFLQGEIFAEKLINANTVLGFTLGTGLGSALYEHGKANDAALWNTPFLSGIAEDYLSTRWFKHRYFQLTGKQLNGVKELSDLVSLEKDAKAVFHEFGTNLAQFIMPLIKEHHAEGVILGGNIAQAFPHFAPSLLEVLTSHQFATPISVTKLRENAALLGAASCCQFMM